MTLATPDEMRREVRRFLREEIANGSFEPCCNSWMTQFNPDFSRRLAERGWLGLTWPMKYGGRGGTFHHRLAITEELLAHGAPIAAHWIADRQIGPNLMRFGSDEQRHAFLPKIARAEIFFCIGMSEPDSGSDLASVRSRAERVEGGWRLHGTKIWTTGAHIAHYMMALVRTSPAGENRHAGLSQFIVDLQADNVTVSPIISMDGGHHFNEVVMDDVFVPDDRLVGREGDGWLQVTSELAFERSGPERYMSTLPLLLEWARQVEADTDASAREALGLLTARLWTLRQMSSAIADSLASGGSPDVAAAMVKDLGTTFERDVIRYVRQHTSAVPELVKGTRLGALLSQSVLDAPTFALRGGTPEILRGIVAKSLGLR